MPACCSWLSRPFCCRRESQHAYIYLYAPTMTGSSSSSSCHGCLVCILFGLCLTLVVTLAAVLMYHLNSTDFIKTKSTEICTTHPLTKKLQYPDFVNTKIDLCENFHAFVCDKWTRRKVVENFNDKDDSEEQWTRMQNEIHQKLMTNTNGQSISNENDHIIPSTYRLYQLCENQSPLILLYELERYFANLSYQEPYQSHLTLFNQTKSTNNSSKSLIFLDPNPFFKILHSSSSSSIVTRIHHRPLPSTISIFSNITILNQTALKHLKQFDNDYRKLLSEENILIKSYEQEYSQDSLIIKRILSFTNYEQCLSSSPSSSLNRSNGLEKLIQLLNYFLHSRLHKFNTKLVDQQIRILNKITDNHTLVERLQRIRTDLRTIEQIVLINNTNTSCIINLLDELLDKRMRSNELHSMINLYLSNNTTEDFISNDWPYLFMLYDRLLKKTPVDTLINFAFFDYYRQYVYPYYQPHLNPINPINISHYNEHYAYTYRTNYPSLPCQIKTCFDIFNCYHPSLLNQLIEIHNQTFLDDAKTLVENLINRFRLLTDQSDNLFLNEKKQILNQLNAIQIRIGHYSSQPNISLSNDFSSYLEYVQFYLRIPYDKQEHSYYIEPIYYPSNQILYLPFGFLSLSSTSMEYHIIKILLKVLRLTILSNPYNIECLLKSSDDEHDPINTTKLSSNDESIVYLLLRSKFIAEQRLILDEYLWPFTNANSLMKNFLIHYTANHYCRNSNGPNAYLNNTYLIDDVHLIFHCEQASSIKQSKCTVN
ncbi:unnamed protein product [Rotaria magnacalcarata]|uniref:Peptidase M13 N-terminal domain-containing protein n=2 Tax=Rotaria magnacalcarata TaxID=392030 RepID=A0A816KEM7_9BILA|nr:unnamed protein product [Rotaria magnacalcarata]CAF1918884.1 unnamed protein product [Rotaria magnacalcarata]